MPHGLMIWNTSHHTLIVLMSITTDHALLSLEWTAQENGGEEKTSMITIAGMVIMMMMIIRL